MIRETGTKRRFDPTLRCHLSRSMAMLVGVEGMRDGALYGQIMSQKLPRTVPYRNLGELVLKIDQIETLLHVFKDAAEKIPDDRFKVLCGKGYEELEQDCQPYKFGGKYIFFLELIGKQNQSLQGRIRGTLTGGSYIYFRSALDLMRILSEKWPDKR